MALAGSALLTVSTLAFALRPERRRARPRARAPGQRRRHHLGGLDGVAVGQHAARTPGARVRHRHGPVLDGRGDRAGRRLVRPRHLAAARLQCLAGVAALTIPLVLARTGGQARSRRSTATCARSARCCATGSCWRRSCSRSSIRCRWARSTCSSRAICTATACATWHIGAALMIGAAFGAVSGPLAGRSADRIGPLRVGVGAAVALVIMPALLITGLSDPAQLLLLVAVAPAFTIMATAMYPLSTQRRGRARRLARRRQRRALGDLGDRLRRRLAALGRRSPTVMATPSTYADRRDRRAPRCWRRSGSSPAGRRSRRRLVAAFELVHVDAGGGSRVGRATDRALRRNAAASQARGSRRARRARSRRPRR